MKSIIWPILFLYCFPTQAYSSYFSLFLIDECLENDKKNGYFEIYCICVWIITGILLIKIYLRYSYMSLNFSDFHGLASGNCVENDTCNGNFFFQRNDTTYPYIFKHSVHVHITFISMCLIYFLIFFIYWRIGSSLPDCWRKWVRGPELPWERSA